LFLIRKRDGQASGISSKEKKKSALYYQVCLGEPRGRNSDDLGQIDNLSKLECADYTRDDSKSEKCLQFVVGFHDRGYSLMSKSEWDLFLAGWFMGWVAMAGIVLLIDIMRYLLL